MTAFEQIMSELKTNRFRPVYFLSGEEPYFIDAISDFIEKNALDDSEKEFNQSVLYGSDLDVLRLIAEAKRFPMMAEKQVVIVKEAQNMKNLAPSPKIKEKKENDENKKIPFQSYFENPQPSTILVINYKYKTIDKRTAFAKSLTKNCVFYESKKLYDNQVPAWIENYLKQQQFSISPKASLLLTEFLGNDLSKIIKELEKLMINVAVKSEITPELIQQHIGISKEYNTFELNDALGTKNILKANRIVNHFAANEKDNPIFMTTGTLYGFFSKLLVYHSLPDKKTAAATLGINPFFIKDYAKAASNYPPAKVRKVVSDLRECDMKSKGWNNDTASQGELLKELVYKILH